MHEWRGGREQALEIMKTKKEKVASLEHIWETNFYNAKRFFNSKGNGNTRSRIKDKWFKDFKRDLEELEIIIKVV